MQATTEDPSNQIRLVQRWRTERGLDWLDRWHPYIIFCLVGLQANAAVYGTLFHGHWLLALFVIWPISLGLLFGCTPLIIERVDEHLQAIEPIDHARAE